MLITITPQGIHIKNKETKDQKINGEIDHKTIEADHWNNVFSKEFSKESDRACVILAAAMLDQAIETILKSCLVPTDSKNDTLLEGAYAPISTFSARIDLAYRIGLISKKFCRDLHLIRKMRNDFAHDVKDCTFERGSVRNRITELRRSSTHVEKMPNVRQSFPDTPRGNFQMVASWMLYQLCIIAEYVETIEDSNEEFGYLKDS